MDLHAPMFDYLQQINFYPDLQLLYNEKLVYMLFIQQRVFGNFSLMFHNM